MVINVRVTTLDSKKMLNMLESDYYSLPLRSAVPSKIYRGQEWYPFSQQPCWRVSLKLIPELHSKSSINKISKNKVNVHIDILLLFLSLLDCNQSKRWICHHFLLQLGALSLLLSSLVYWIPRWRLFKCDHTTLKKKPTRCECLSHYVLSSGFGKYSTGEKTRMNSYDAHDFWGLWIIGAS